MALVEYKHEKAKTQHSSHPTYQAMIDLGNRAQVPVFGARYKDDFSSWQIVALNGCAKQWLPERVTFTEREWVTFLYRIRGYELPAEVFGAEEAI